MPVSVKAAIPHDDYYAYMRAADPATTPPTGLPPRTPRRSSWATTREPCAALVGAATVLLAGNLIQVGACADSAGQRQV